MKRVTATPPMDFFESISRYTAPADLIIPRWQADRTIMIIKMFPFSCGMTEYVQKQRSRFSLMTNRFAGEIYNTCWYNSNCPPPCVKSSTRIQTTNWEEPRWLQAEKQADKLIFCSIRLAANTFGCSHQHVIANPIFFIYHVRDIMFFNVYVDICNVYW